MPIKNHNGKVFAGAQTILIPPVTAADCTIYPSLEQLALEEHKAARGSTIRYGRGWARRPLDEIQTTCTPLTPIPSSTDPMFPVKNAPCNIIGTNFYGIEGQLHIGDADTWPMCIVTTLQPITSWAAALIAVTAMTWGGPGIGAWIYVRNQYGLRNPNGLAFMWAP